MKFQRIGTEKPRAATRIVAFTALLLLAGATAFAVDEDLPPPDANLTLPSGTGRPSTSTAVQIEDETLPSPSLGDDALPEPSADRGQENVRNQVNRPPEDDEIFLPTPNVNDNINYAPVGRPAPRMSSEDVDWRVITANRPTFSLIMGMANKGYNTILPKGRITGFTAGASVRMASLGQTVFFHIQAAYSWFKVGDVGSLTEVKDEQLQYGGLLEFGIGRRLSFYTSLLRRQSRVSDGRISPTLPANYHPEDVENVGEDPTFYLGAGLQWDFHVIPHGSIGLRGHIERDLYALTFVFAMEPAPRKKFSLTYEDPR